MIRRPKDDNLSIGKKIQNFIEEAISLKLDEFVDTYEDEIKTQIVSEEVKNSTKFLGGEFIVEYGDEAQFRFSYDLYFQQTGQSPTKVSVKSRPQELKRLDKDARAELKTEKTIKFQIDPPTKEERDKILREIKK